MHASRWRPDALPQCRCSGIGMAQRHHTGSCPCVLQCFSLSFSINPPQEFAVFVCSVFAINCSCRRRGVGGVPMHCSNAAGAALAQCTGTPPAWLPMHKLRLATRSCIPAYLCLPRHTPPCCEGVCPHWRHTLLWVEPGIAVLTQVWIVADATIRCPRYHHVTPTVA